MKEIKCTIIQDILPLYIDGVVSQDTKEMVDEHLKHCDKCQSEYVSMKRELYLPIKNKDSLIHNISKEWRKKKVRISILSILVTTIILVGAFSYVFYYETMIPYSENLIKIERQNNQLVSRYSGESYAGVSIMHPKSIEIDGEKRNVSFVSYTKTIANSPSRNLNFNEGFHEHEDIFIFPESEKIDAVYYVDFEMEDIISGDDSWDSILERGVLIWGK